MHYNVHYEYFYNVLYMKALSKVLPFICLFVYYAFKYVTMFSQVKIQYDMSTHKTCSQLLSVTFNFSQFRETKP